MVLFLKKDADGSTQPIWRGVKRKVDVEGPDRAFEFDHKRQFKDRKRPFVMYMVQGLPVMPGDPGQLVTNLARSNKNRELAIAALKEVDALDPYCIKLEHCKAIYAPVVPSYPTKKGPNKQPDPVAVDQVFLNKSGGSLIRWLLAMFEDQFQILDALTATLPSVAWDGLGPGGSSLTSRPLDLHDEIWKCASRWMDVRMRHMTQATKVHYFTTRGGDYNPYTNLVDKARHAVSDDERKHALRQGVLPPTSSVDMRISQINSLVHGGDLEGDLALMTSWDQLGVPDRSTQLRKDFFAACWFEWYGELSEDAAAMIVRGAKEASPRRQYFLNHRHFINKFVTVRCTVASDLGAPPAAPAPGAPPPPPPPLPQGMTVEQAAAVAARRRRDFADWATCRERFFDYTDALNALALNQDNQVWANEAENRAKVLYDVVSTLASWEKDSKPSRSLYWKPAEYMAWEWPGVGTPTGPLTLNNPSTLYMSPPPAWAPPVPAAAPVRRQAPRAPPPGSPSSTVR